MTHLKLSVDGSMLNNLQIILYVRAYGISIFIFILQYNQAFGEKREM